MEDKNWQHGIPQVFMLGSLKVEEIKRKVKYPHLLTLYKSKKPYKSPIAWRLRVEEWLEENMEHEVEVIWFTNKYDSTYQYCTIFCTSEEDYVKIILQWDVEGPQEII